MIRIYDNIKKEVFMKTREQVIEFIQKQKVAFIASVDEDGFPNMKAMFVPRKIDGNYFYFTTNIQRQASIFTIKAVLNMKVLC